MSDFIFQNQQTSKSKDEQINNAVSKPNLKVFLKPLLAFGLSIGLIVLSVYNERLFLEELIVVSSIIGLISVIYLLSQRKDK